MVTYLRVQKPWNSINRRCIIDNDKMKSKDNPYNFKDYDRGGETLRFH